MESKCPHYDYGKSADKALGAYCTLKKTCVELSDCEECLKPLEDTFSEMFHINVKMNCQHKSLTDSEVDEMIQQLESGCANI